MGDKLPTENDVILLGTGLPESIIAASLSRIDCQILHMDWFDFYGGCWGSFNLRTFRKLLRSKLEKQNDEFPKINFKDIHLEEGEKLIELFKQPEIITNVDDYPKISNIEIKEEFSTLTWMDVIDKPFKSVDLNKSVKNDDETISEEHDSPLITISDEQTLMDETEPNQQVNLNSTEDKLSTDDVKQREENCESEGTKSLPLCEVSVDDIISKDRKFHIDLISKLLYNRGSMVELLISSDVARYCEFKIVSRVLTLLDEKFQIVPCSKSDVFATSAVGVFEKRLLMKFLTMALTYNEKPEEYEGFESKKFTEYLEHKRLTRTLKHYIQHAIAMVDDDANTMQGLAATQKYLLSLGRYGNSSFLFPMYGIGELIQCFCRLSAVFGGIYCLKRSLAAIVIDSNNDLVSVIDSTGEKLKTKWLVVDPMYIKPNMLPTSCSKRLISRAILITNKSIYTDTENHITLCNIGQGSKKNILMQELSPLSLTCLDPYYIVHLTCEGMTDARSDLCGFIEDHFNCTDLHDPSKIDKPYVVWHVYFNVESIHVECPQVMFNKVVITSGPDAQLDCDRPIREAEEVFKKICPDQPFLPKAPRPDEIIYGEEGDRKTLSLNQKDEVETENKGEDKSE